MSRDDAPPARASFLDHYLAGELSAFFDLAPGDVGAALRAPRDVDRVALAAAMRDHANRLGAPGAVLDSLKKLEHPDARAVVTGQQTGLLLGPAYTLSKAISAIRLAQRLDRPERPVVPIFWLASQDHDTAEIDHAVVLDGSERLLRVALQLPAETPAGRISLDASMVATVERALARFEPTPRFGGEVGELLRGSAAVAATFADWFAALLYRLLGDQGLAIFDPMDGAAAPLLKPVLERELARPEASVAEVTAAGRRLRSLGFDPQLGRGADATNLFLEIDGDVAPRRVLLRHEGRNFRLEGKVLSIADVRARLDADPAALTPAAGLRPIVQDAVLPTAAVVLGPGELRYFAQLRGVYALHGVAMPLVWPRATATLVEPPVGRILDKFGIDVAGFQADPDGCLHRVLLARSGYGERFRSAASRLEQVMDELLTEVAGIDPTLQGTVERGRGYLEATLGRLRGKTAAALAREDGTTRRQFERLRQQLLPDGAPAERVLSPFGSFLKFGVRPTMDAYLSIAAEGAHELRI